MTNTMLQALEYGVLGLCAITLVLVWRMLVAEQNREGDPRKGILQASYVFMAFCFALAVLNGVVQLREQEAPQAVMDEVTTLRAQLVESQAQIRERDDKLLKIRSAAGPIIGARSNIVAGLPPGPQRDTLMHLLTALRSALR